MTKLAIGIDLHRCIGCNTCSIACKMQNNVPDGMLWNLRAYRGRGDVRRRCRRVSQPFAYVSAGCLPALRESCMHAKVCLTGATYKDEQGRVEIDYDRCIGCRMCMGACPYNARVFNWNEPARATGFHYGDAGVPVRPRGVAEKCSLCKERTDRLRRTVCARIAARVMLACSATWIIRIRQCRGFGVVAVMRCSRKRARVHKCFTVNLGGLMDG